MKLRSEDEDRDREDPGRLRACPPELLLQRKHEDAPRVESPQRQVHQQGPGDPPPPVDHHFPRTVPVSHVGSSLPAAFLPGFRRFPCIPPLCRLSKLLGRGAGRSVKPLTTRPVRVELAEKCTACETYYRPALPRDYREGRKGEMEMKDGRSDDKVVGRGVPDRCDTPLPVRIRPGPRGPRVGDVGGSDGGGGTPSEIPPPLSHTPSELFAGAGTLSILGLGAFVAFLVDAGRERRSPGTRPMRAGMESMVSWKRTRRLWINGKQQRTRA